MKFGVYCVVSRELFKVSKQGNKMIMMIQKDNSSNSIMKDGLEVKGTEGSPTIKPVHFSQEK